MNILEDICEMSLIRICKTHQMNNNCHIQQHEGLIEEYMWLDFSYLVMSLAQIDN